MYKVVSEWVRENVEGDSGIGCQTVVAIAITDVDTDIKMDIEQYDFSIDETDGYEYKSEGATHVVRVLTVVEGIELVDGDNFYFRLDGEEFILINEPDAPAFCGGYLDEGMKWVNERAMKLVPQFE